MKATIYLPIISVISLFSNTAFFQNSVIQADCVEIRFLKTAKPLAFKVQDKTQLMFLKDLVTKSKRDNSLKCDSTAEIIYFRKNVVVFKVYYSSSVTGSKYKSFAATFNNNNRQVTSLVNYGSGMLIDEEYYNLTK